MGSLRSPNYDSWLPNILSLDLSQLALIGGVDPRVDLTLDLSGAVRPREVPIAAKLASGGTAKATAATAERGRHTHEH